MPSPILVFGAVLMAGVISAASIDVEPRRIVANDCADVHLFLAKGNDEPYPGRQGKLVSAVCDGLESCDYEDIQYYNPKDYPYCVGVNEGIANGWSQITAYNTRCPDSKLVLSGYSQGAHIVGDILVGGGGTIFENCTQDDTPSLPPNTPIGQAIAAVVTFGDPRHVANQPFNYLDGAAYSGRWPRDSQQLANAAAFAGIWRDYCHAADPTCAGGDIVEAHWNYFDLYSDEVADFIYQKLAAAGCGESPDLWL